jgi:hypothetical protein
VGFLFCLGFVGFIGFVIYGLANGDSRTYARLMTQGRVARGIVLEVGPLPLIRSESSVRPSFRRRLMRLDVELPGVAPYELYTNIAYPSNMARAVLPGATVEVRVDPKNAKRLMIVGPGANLSAGFFTPALPGATPGGLTLPPPPKR